MKKNLRLLGLILAMPWLMLGDVALAAKDYDPEIKEYLKQLQERRKQEVRDEKQARRSDPERRLRPYQTIEELGAELDLLVSENPALLSQGVYGQSVAGRDLRWVKISTGPGDKTEVLVTANIHAQELAGGQMAMTLIRHFAKYYGKDCWTTQLLKNADLYIIPIVNPDEMERAALTQSKYGMTGFIRKNENEVDLNRNFPYPPDATDRLADEAGSEKQRKMTYRGPYPFSEPETSALDAFIATHHFVLSLNYHTSGGLILYPPGVYPQDEPDTALMREIGLAYQDRQFDKYSVQPSIDLYPTLGDLDDYLYHHYGILSFTVEVGTGMEKRALKARNGSLSPIFWAYNVYELEQEAANNVYGALAMIEWAIKVHQEPSLIKWQKPTETWVGEEESKK